MLSPKDLEQNEISKISMSELITEIDETLKTTYLRYQNRIEVILSGEYPKAIRDKVADKYMNVAGWSNVTHHTSSENGERPGLTNFTFYL